MIALGELVGQSGRVFAFEPMFATADCLTKTRARNGPGQVTVLPFALGDVETIEIRRIPTVRGMADMPVAPVQAPEAVVVSSLDWVWPRISSDDPRVHRVKIDVHRSTSRVYKSTCCEE